MSEIFEVSDKWVVSEEWVRDSTVGSMGMKTIGLVCPEPSLALTPSMPILGTIDQIGEILRAKSITQLIVLHE